MFRLAPVLLTALAVAAPASAAADGRTRIVVVASEARGVGSALQQALLIYTGDLGCRVTLARAEPEPGSADFIVRLPQGADSALDVERLNPPARRSLALGGGATADFTGAALRVRAFVQAPVRVRQASVDDVASQPLAAESAVASDEPAASTPAAVGGSGSDAPGRVPVPAAPAEVARERIRQPILPSGPAPDRIAMPAATGWAWSVGVRSGLERLPGRSAGSLTFIAARRIDTLLSAAVEGSFAANRGDDDGGPTWRDRLVGLSLCGDWTVGRLVVSAGARARLHSLRVQLAGTDLPLATAGFALEERDTQKPGKARVPKARKEKGSAAPTETLTALGLGVVASVSYPIVPRLHAELVAAAEGTTAGLGSAVPTVAFSAGLAWRLP